MLGPKWAGIWLLREQLEVNKNENDEVPSPESMSIFYEGYIMHSMFPKIYSLVCLPKKTGAYVYKTSIAQL